MQRAARLAELGRREDWEKRRRGEEETWRRGDWAKRAGGVEGVMGEREA